MSSSLGVDAAAAALLDASFTALEDDGVLDVVREVEQATHLLPAELVLSGERIRAHLDPDGRLSDDHDRVRRRAFTVGVQGGDGMSPVRGVLDSACRAAVDAALTPLTRPAPTTDGGVVVPDPRTPAQRGHDALAARAMAAGTAGTSSGAPTTVVISIGIHDLERRAGQATTATGGSLSIPDALDLAADSSWILALVTVRGNRCGSHAPNASPQGPNAEPCS